nr:predicted GPI-anchored protein 58 [Salvelinus alpinus]
MAHVPRTRSVPPITGTVAAPRHTAPFRSRSLPLSPVLSVPQAGPQCRALEPPVPGPCHAQSRPVPSEPPALLRGPGISAFPVVLTSRPSPQGPAPSVPQRRPLFAAVCLVPTTAHADYFEASASLPGSRPEPGPPSGAAQTIHARQSGAASTAPASDRSRHRPEVPQGRPRAARQQEPQTARQSGQPARSRPPSQEPGRAIRSQRAGQATASQELQEPPFSRSCPFHPGAALQSELASVRAISQA